MKKIFIILGSIGFVVGLLMFNYGVTLTAEYNESRSTLPSCEYDPDVSCVPPIHSIQYMTVLAIPLSLVSATVLAFGFIKSKYYYVYMPVISALLITAFFAILLSGAS